MLYRRGNVTMRTLKEHKNNVVVTPAPTRLLQVHSRHAASMPTENAAQRHARTKAEAAVMSVVVYDSEPAGR